MINLTNLPALTVQPSPVLRSLRNLKRQRNRVGQILRSIILLELLMIGNGIMGELYHVKEMWYVVQASLDWFILIPVVLLRDIPKQTKIEMGVLLITSLSVNLITLRDYITGENLLYDHYIFIMDFLYWACMTSLFWIIGKNLYKQIRDY